MSAYCTPQGRMLVNFRLFRRGADYFIQLPLERLAPFQKRLSMFVLMSKVEIEDVSDQQVRMGVTGACAEGLLNGLYSALPEQPGEVRHVDDVTLLRLPGAEPRFEIIAPAEQATAAWTHCATEATPASRDYWSLLDIRAGLGSVYDATAEAFVPQMINLQMVDGVSFDKGCYVGQEVVARMKYLGKLKRRMFLARVDGDEQPQAGDELHAPGTDESGQGSGKIVDARPSPEGGFELLAVIEESAVEGGDIRLGGADGPRLELMELPYTLDEE
jgi:folate-binding protein YgfZ